MQLRKELWEEVKRLRSEGQIALIIGQSLWRGEEILVINSMHYSLKVNSAII